MKQQHQQYRDYFKDKPVKPWGVSRFGELLFEEGFWEVQQLEGAKDIGLVSDVYMLSIYIDNKRVHIIPECRKGGTPCTVTDNATHL